MRIVWAVIDNTPYDGGQTLSLHEHPMDAFKAAGHFDEEGRPKYGNRAEHNDVEAQALYEAGEGYEENEWVSLRDITTEQYVSLYYIPSLLRKEAEGHRITKDERRYLDQHATLVDQILQRDART
jgi:hypothetical protein